MAFSSTGENTQIRIFTLCDHIFQILRSVLKFCEHNFFFRPFFDTLFFSKKSKKSKKVKKIVEKCLKAIFSSIVILNNV